MVTFTDFRAGVESTVYAYQHHIDGRYLVQYRYPLYTRCRDENKAVVKMQKAKPVFAGVLILLVTAIVNLQAQQTPSSVQPNHNQNTTPATASTPPTTPPSTYLLGPDDQIMIQGPEMDELVNRPYRIAPDGYVTLPMLGRIKAGGLTISGFETELTQAASKYVRNPQLVASVVEFRSQPISVVGAVTLPGTQQLQGRKTLMQVISMVGGFRTDAGNTLSITRELQWGALPLPHATVDATGKFSVAEISIPDLLREKTPQFNILIMPNDVITVPVSETVYVVGDVHKPGGFLLGEQKHITVLQAVAMAEGISGTSDAKHSRIIHHGSDNSVRGETPVDVKRIVAGKAEDVPLNGGDILFVPGSLSKKAGIRTVDAAIQTASGVAVWRF